MKKKMTRSENMAKIKSKDTKPEIYLRKILWHKGYRYRKNYSKLPGKPDLYLAKYKTAIFVNGCFWHMHEDCKLSSIPKTNTEFWREKLEGNVARDKRDYEILQKMGIQVLVVWGCEIKEMRKDPKFEQEYLDSLIQQIKEGH